MLPFGLTPPTLQPDVRRGAIFVTYNGLLDPLGSSQILPYLERLRQDRPIHILSYERSARLADLPRLEAMEQRVKTQQIGWTRLLYHKWPSLPATAWDVAAGALALRVLLRGNKFGLVHARGNLPMTIARRAGATVPLLFDIRGLQTEEYVDGGIWQVGELKWRFSKQAEKGFYKQAAGAVVLTENIRPYVRDRFAVFGRCPPLEVIPCCVDLDRFQFDQAARTQRRQQLGIDHTTTLFIYSGSIGTWYLPDEMAAFVQSFSEQTKRPVCLLWMVNNDESMVHEASRRAGLSTAQYRVLQATPTEVPGYLSAADVALALIEPCFSKRASSPTKYAEYLAIGLPLILHAAVGDGKVLVDRKVAVSPRDTATPEQDLLALLRKPRSHFRATAEQLFHIDTVAIPAYRRLYQRLMNE